MIDISSYVSKNKEKEVLTYVYVHEIEDKKYAVATDSFRLAQVELTKGSEYIGNGFYTPKAWKEITKLINKDKGESMLDIKHISEKELLHQPEIEKYPEYTRIIPAISEMEVFTGKLNVNADYFSEMIKAIKDSFSQIDFNRISQNDNLYMFQEYETTILIMKMNK